jgi:hypothetical protein
VNLVKKIFYKESRFKKVTFSSPDGVGDFIMRMPMFQAFLEEGYRLQLLIREPAAALARDLFPEVETHVLKEDPYNPALKKRQRPFRADFRSIKRFAPDLYVATAFQLTFLDEEYIKQSYSSVRIAGFVAKEPRWSSNTIDNPDELAKKYSVRIPVSITLKESDKYLFMSQVLLQRPLTTMPPRQPSEEAITHACRLMNLAGLKKGGFLVICVGWRNGLKFKDWGEENWIRFLSDVALTETKTLVFLGNKEESESIERIRSALPAQSHHLNLASDPPSLPVSYALVSLSSGYLGRDGGIMHMAAATGRSIMAIYGGFHWPRFLPTAAKGLVITRSIDCRGCNRVCPYPEPYCITSIPSETVLKEWRNSRDESVLRVVELETWIDNNETDRQIDAKEYSWQTQLEQRKRWRDDKPKDWPGFMNPFKR